MTSQPRSPWWPKTIEDPAPDWILQFHTLTDDATKDRWGRRAAVFIRQHRSDTGVGPTFSELFTHLLPDTHGLPAPFPSGLDGSARRLLLHAFRIHAAVQWRRDGWIAWDHGVPRSLRTSRPRRGDRTRKTYPR